MKKVLLVSSEYAGHGHKSVHTALLQGFKRLCGDAVECRAINGFALGAADLVAMERLYNVCVQYFPGLWNQIFSLSFAGKDFINAKVFRSVKRKFLKAIESFKPDLIVNLHPLFSGSLLDILERKNIGTRFYIVITDLVSIADLWFDNRADKIFSPSREVAEYMAQNGVDESKIVTAGLPVREGFESGIESKDDIEKNTNTADKPRILVLNNSEKSKRLIRIARGLSERLDCEVTLVCGRNKGTYEAVSKFFEGRDCKPRIIGYTKELNKLFLESDILVTRAGPTAIMEAVNCLLPIVSMGALPGQEEGNPAYLEKHGLGYKASSTDDIFSKAELLLQNNGEKLVEMRKRQFDYCGRNARERIVSHIAGDLLGESGG